MTTNIAGASPVDRPVRPVAYVQRMGSYQGVPHYGCLLTIEAEKRMKVNDPLYGQAELDTAVAAERERMNLHAVTLAETARRVEQERCAEYLMQQAALCPEDSACRAVLESVSAVVRLYGPNDLAQRRP